MPSARRPKKKASAARTHPALWEACKRAAVRKMDGVFSARAMQLAVQLYKRAGGGYRTRKPAARDNALRRWTAEDWGYAGRAGASRYLPRAVRERLTPSERRRTNRTKRAAAGQWSRQPADVARKAAVIRRKLWAGKKQGSKPGLGAKKRSTRSERAKKAPARPARPAPTRRRLKS
jgi:hypothetical protein